MTSRVHPSRLPIPALLQACTEAHVRRSGPGGQHRNRVATGVVLKHNETGIAGEASERRSQLENKVNAIHRLRVQLAVRVRLPCAVEQWIPSGMFLARSVLIFFLLYSYISYHHSFSSHSLCTPLYPLLWLLFVRMSVPLPPFVSCQHQARDAAVQQGPR